MENRYAGMTVNERLYVSGLMDEFDRAVSKKNTEIARYILEKIDLTEASIGPILKKHGLLKEI